MAASTIVQDHADGTKKVAIDAATIATGTTRTITAPDRDVDLNDPQNVALPHSVTAPQSSIPSTMATEGQLDLAASQHQKFTATADRVLTSTGVAVPGTTIYVEVDPSGFVVSVPASWDPFGRYTQPSLTDKFILSFYVRDDNSFELRYPTG